jgi:hypothetical protein
MKDKHTRGLFDVDEEPAVLPAEEVAALLGLKKPDLEFPMARASDPVTSHEAADRVATGGIAHGQRAAILEKVRELPGCTASEIGRALGHAGNHVACRRLPELEEKELVKRGTPRICKVTGFRAATWWQP